MNSYMVNDLREFINEYKENTILNNENNLKLIKLYKKTNDIKYKNEIILGNLRLIISVVLKYYRKDMSLYSIQIRDIISIGIIGLSEGIEKFNIERSSCFTSVVTNYIRRNIELEIIKYRNIVNCPIWLERKKYNINKYIKKYNLENNILPSFDKISKETNTSNKNIIKYYELRNTKNFLSLNLDREDKNGDLINNIEDEIIDTKQSIRYEKVDNKIIFDKILSCLTDKQKVTLQKLIDLSHGLYKNQDEIAKELQVTNQNISAMFSLIVKKVKNLVASKEIENIFQL
jgi:RNA polymerase sporulation-specific sigma factor